MIVGAPKFHERMRRRRGGTRSSVLMEHAVRTSMPIMVPALPQNAVRIGTAALSAIEWAEPGVCGVTNRRSRPIPRPPVAYCLLGLSVLVP